MQLRNKSSQLPTPEMTAGDRAILHQLVQSEGYRVLLDILHRFCTRQEVEMLSTPPENPTAIQQQWQAMRAAWNMFTAMQVEALNAAGIHQAARALSLEQTARNHAENDLSALEEGDYL